MSREEATEEVESVDELTSQMTGLGLSDDSEDEKELECHARMIAFFAHKGGVSKTTNVHHLGHMLAKQFKFKVLMIDGDPQQNLTQSVCRSAKKDVHWRDSVERGTIFTALERLHYGMKDGEYIEPANCVQIDCNNGEDDDAGQLWLLPGSLDLAKLEPQITFAHNLTNPGAFPLFDDIAGAFRHLFVATSAHYDIDVALIDMGPSVGELNKSLFWSADYFVLPCSADAYCKTTVQTMQATLPLWRRQQKLLSEVTAEMTLPLNPTPPKLLGVLFSMFQTAGKNKKPIKDSQHWMDIIKQTVRMELAPTLKKIDMLHPFCAEDFTLSEIPHFLSLMPIAQRSYCPIYDIASKSGYFTVNEDGDQIAMNKTEIARHEARAKYFEKTYQRLGENILAMINAEEEDEENEAEVAN